MNQIVEEFKEEYTKELNRQKFPQEIMEGFTLESCIGSNEEGSAYLFRQSATGRKYVVKVRDIAQRYRMDMEEDVLQKLGETDFATGRLIKRVDDEENCFLMREYVEGENLENYYRNRQQGVEGPEGGNRQGLSESEIVKIGMAVCGQLKQLHEMTPPLIHRDIKPQNIIMTPEGEIRLIDFDSVRSYHEGKERDTYFLGTAQTAAPEQYGFEQTDSRTDLYGLGKTLLYLACGSYQDSDLEKTHYSKRLKRIIHKSLSLLKKERFSSASVMYEQLQKCGKERLSPRHIMALGGTALLLAAVAFWGGRQYMQGHGEIKSAVMQDGLLFGGEFAEKEALRLKEVRVVSFDSKTLEMAVRTALQFDADRQITYGDLKNVSELRVIGNVWMPAQSKYYFQLQDCPDYQGSPDYKEKGDIEDLSLLAQMPNLKSVYLCNQNIQDITPLKDLELVVLALSGNNIKDFSVISEMPSLRSLYIGKNPVDNLDFLEGNNFLELFNMGSNKVVSFKPLESTAIEELWIMGCEVPDDSYTSLAAMEKLTRLYTYSLSEGQLNALKGSKELAELYLWGESGAANLESLSGVDKLRVLVLGNQFVSLDGVGNLNNLGLLVLGANTLDVRALENTGNVVQLDISGCGTRFKDYALIAQMKGLDKVYYAQVQLEALQEVLPDTVRLEAVD